MQLNVVQCITYIYSVAILKYLVRRFTDYFVEINWLKQQMAFPVEWKVGLILFQKRGKPLTSADAVRPITTSPTIGKLYENVLLYEMNCRLDSLSFFSATQHGFSANKTRNSSSQS